MTEHRLGVLVRFAGILRELGLSITTDRLAVAAELVGHWHAAGGCEPYWPLRVAFCLNETDVQCFDAAYRRWIDRPPADGAASSGAVAIAVQPRVEDAAGAPTEDAAGAPTEDAAGAPTEDADGGAGNAAELSTRDFDDLTGEQLQEVAAWTQQLRPVPQRRTMHRRPASLGGIDAPRTMRLMLRDNGELLRLRHRRNALSPLRILVLVDVSASMRPYSDVLLQFGYATLQANPDTAEVFAVGTQFSHLTRQLSMRRVELALRAAGATRTDWAKGTTLGVALQDFLRRWGGSRAVRSAIIVLGSDGFEFHDSALLISQVARLAALSRAFIWVDPGHRTAHDRPVDDRIAQAQAHATTVLGCHSYEALRELAEAITNA